MNTTGTIEWSSAKPRATDDMIATVEKQLGIHYPADFRVLAPTIHDSRPSLVTFFYNHRGLGRVGSSFSYVLSFNPTSSAYVPRKMANLESGLIPAGVVPFGIDGGGDLMAFDFRQDADNPPVVYVAISDAEEEGERHIYPLAPSFSAFLDMLVADPDQPSPSGDRVDEVPSTADRR